MKSAYEMRDDQIARFEAYLKTHDVSNGIKPRHFIQVLKTHRNIIDYFHFNEPGHIETRNPLVAVLGDSVSCGHFEAVDLARGLIAHDPDACYMAQVCRMLQEAYPLTAVSLLNSAIAGDNIVGMERRLTRDVIVHQPDLVVLNATLNWSEHRGTLADFRRAYRHVVERVLWETQADLLLLTPNVSTYEEELVKRVQVVLELAEEYHLPLVDLHRMFADVLKPGEYPGALANHENHPTVKGHLFMAKAIMKALVE